MQQAHAWAAGAVLTVLILLAAACGGDGSSDTIIGPEPTSTFTNDTGGETTSTSQGAATEDDTPTTSQRETTTTTEAITTTTATVPAGADLGVREEPPEGVPAAFDKFLGGDGVPEPCDFDSLDPPPYVASNRVLQYGIVGYSIGLTVEFCILGFDPSTTVEFELETPGGEVRRWDLALGGGAARLGVDLLTAVEVTSRVAERGNYATYWSLYPHTPYGVYTVRGRQGGVVVSSSIEVERPFEVILRRLDHGSDLDSASGGSALFGLYGYPPNRDVPLLVYTRSGEFVAALGMIQVSDLGEALYELVVDSGAPGEYCLVTDHQIDQISRSSELGFEHLADPCWSGASGFTLS